MNSYEIKQAARRERLENAAERAQRESDAAFNRSRALTAGIPFGQPILVGHHSEKRHRRAVEKSWDALGRGVEASKRAQALAARAAGVGTGGVSSDDPEAVTKLREELAPLQARQAMMKAANAIIRSALPRKPKRRIQLDPATGGTVLVKSPVAPRDPEKIEAAIVKLVALGLGEGVARELFSPDFAGRIGFADYQLQNNGANIRRIEARIGDLERRAVQREEIAAEVAAAEEAGTQLPNEKVIGEVRIVQNFDANRLQMFFPGKPSYDVRAKLKSYGFRWAPSEGAWQRHLSNAATYSAQEIANSLVSQEVR